MSSTCPTAPERYRVLTHQEWEAQKDNIKALYVDEGRPLPKVVRRMQKFHRFKATEKMYKTRFVSWGWKKYKPRKTTTNDDSPPGTDLQSEDHLGTRTLRAEPRSELEDSGIPMQNNGRLSSNQEVHGTSSAPEFISLPPEDSSSEPSKDSGSVQTVGPVLVGPRHPTSEEENFSILKKAYSEREATTDAVDDWLEDEQSSKSRTLLSKSESKQAQHLSSRGIPELSSNTPRSPIDQSGFSDIIDWTGGQGLPQNDPSQGVTQDDPSQEEEEIIHMLACCARAKRSSSASGQPQVIHRSSTFSSISRSYASYSSAAYRFHPEQPSSGMIDLSEDDSTHDEGEKQSTFYQGAALSGHSTATRLNLPGGMARRDQGRFSSSLVSKPHPSHPSMVYSRGEAKKVAKDKVVVDQHKKVEDLAQSFINLGLDMPRSKDCNAAYRK